MSLRTRPGPRPAGFIEPALRSPGLPPRGSEWVHEIKFDGFRTLARRDGTRVRLFTRNGYDDWTDRFPLVRAGMAALKVPSCLIDGEAVCCEEDGIPSFQALRRRRNGRTARILSPSSVRCQARQDLRMATTAEGVETQV